MLDLFSPLISLGSALIIDESSSGKVCIGNLFLVFACCICIFNSLSSQHGGPYSRYRRKKTGCRKAMRATMMLSKYFTSLSYTSHSHLRIFATLDRLCVFMITVFYFSRPNKLASFDDMALRILLIFTVFVLIVQTSHQNGVEF